MPEGGEAKSDTNLNYFLEEYGVAVNNDSVVRSAYFKYFHPKENLISGGVLNDAIGGGKRGGFGEDDNTQAGLSFVYPFGASLMV
jgi:intraflagellar transport protein 52